MSSFTTDAAGWGWSAFHRVSTAQAPRSTISIPSRGSCPVPSSAFLASATRLACFSAGAAGVELHRARQLSLPESLLTATATSRPPTTMTTAMPTSTFRLFSRSSTRPPPPDR